LAFVFEETVTLTDGLWQVQMDGLRMYIIEPMQPLLPHVVGTDNGI
jgi:hypothetical protein